jgi:hypothetical protein
MSTFFPDNPTDRLRKFLPRRRTSRHDRNFVPSGADALEARMVMSLSAPAVEMLSATTTDSKSVTIEYQVNNSAADSPLELGIYRSSNGQFSADDSLVTTVTLDTPEAASAPGTITVDQNGAAATANGIHELTVPLAEGLPPFPEKPYVIVVANPEAATATTEQSQVASFRTYTIGIVTHGGIQDPSWKHGPPWQIETAAMMRREGFDSVIAYNWVQQSSTPGAAIKQSPRLARMILGAASKFPTNDPVDLEFIGHSEGTVVNTYALITLDREMTPGLKEGFIYDILLDPHAANNNVPGQQMSFGGAIGGIAHAIVSNYQSDAKDPPAFIPSSVDQADVFFQHSQATSDEIYNLWGQVPVKSEGPIVHYYNLTAMGVTHSGKTGVNYWFRDFIAPTLGAQAPLIQQLRLSGQIDNSSIPSAPSGVDANSPAERVTRRADHVYGREQVVTTAEPEFSGTAAPGSIIRLALSPARKPMDIHLAGRAVASSTGQWSVTPIRPLLNGQYRTLVTAFSRKLATRPGLAIVATQPLGRLVVKSASE